MDRIELAIGIGLLAVGAITLVWGRITYWYIDAQMKPIYKAWPEAFWNGYEFQRKLLRYVGPLFMLFLGTVFIVTS